MNFDENTYRQIDSFLRGELNEIESKNFEQRLSSDVEFAAAVEIERMSHEATIHANRARLREKISADLRHLDRRKNWKWGIGIGLIVLFATGLAAIILPKEELTMASVTEEENQRIPEKNDIVKQGVLIPDESSVIINNSENTTTSSTPIRQNTPLKEQATLHETKTADALKVQNSNTLIVETPKTQPVIINENSTLKAEPAINPCTNIRWQISPIIQASCKDDANGSIDLVDQIIGGKSPYDVLINNQQTNGRLNQLEAGSYTIKVIDEQGCSNSLEVTVDVKQCLPTNFTFNPNIEESLLIHENFDSYELTIISQSGRKVYNSSSQGDVIWTGQSSDGNPLPDGMYIYILRTDELQQKGEITLMH